MSKQELKTVLILVLSPATSGNGNFEARLDGADYVLCVSRTPFFDAARELVADGYNPDTDLILRHGDSGMDCLRAKIGAVASLTVEETDYGPKLRRWKPFSTLAVKPGIVADHGPLPPGGPTEILRQAHESESPGPTGPTI